MGGTSPDNSACLSKDTKIQENQKHHSCRDSTLGTDLWTDGLICAFEFVRGRKKIIGSKSCSKIQSAQRDPIEATKKHVPRSGPPNSLTHIAEPDYEIDAFDCHSHWVPIGWSRISELVQTVHVDEGWASRPIQFTDDEEDDVTVAEVAAPYWELPVGPTWWCHVDAANPFISAWLSKTQWLHRAISNALRDESKLMSERMKFLLYEVIIVLFFLFFRKQVIIEFISEHFNSMAAFASSLFSSFCVWSLHKMNNCFCSSSPLGLYFRRQK